MRFALVAALVLGAGVAAPGTAGAEVPDAKCDVTPDSAMGDVRVAQTFTALHTGHLVRFEALSARLSSSSTWTVQINTVDATGKPANTTLAQTAITVPGSPPSDPAPVGGSFASPVFVNAGTAYALVVISGGTNYPMASMAGTCPGQVFGDSSLNGSWPFSRPTFDLDFATFVEPSNSFSLVGKPKLNKHKGTARLTVEVPGPGTLALRGNGIVPQTASAARAVTAASRVRLTVRSKGRKRRVLNRGGKVKASPTITYTPAGGASSAKSTRIKLIKRR